MAQKLIDAGLTNIAELRTPKYSKILTRSQKIGVQYLGHLEKPVSRDEAETVAVRKFVHLSDIPCIYILLGIYTFEYLSKVRSHSRWQLVSHRIF
jgi:hypothetical protein